MTFADIIDLWPSIEALADDIGAPYERVRAWRHRSSVRAVHFAAIAAAAEKRGLSQVTIGALVAAAAKSGSSPGASRFDHHVAA